MSQPQPEFPAEELANAAKRAGRSHAETSLLETPLPWSPDHVVMISAVLNGVVAEVVEPFSERFQPSERSSFIKAMQDIAMDAFRARCLELSGASPFGTA